VTVGRGLVVTNRHVVEGAATVQVRRAGWVRLAAVVQADADRDLALLRVLDLLDIPVPLRVSTSLKVGEPVFTIVIRRVLELTLALPGPH
jgi:S1-C subfamily serine protease